MSSLPKRKLSEHRSLLAPAPRIKRGGLTDFAFAIDISPRRAELVDRINSNPLMKPHRHIPQFSTELSVAIHELVERLRRFRQKK